MSCVTVCIKMDEADKKALDEFAKKRTRGNRSKVIKDAISKHIDRDVF